MNADRFGRRNGKKLAETVRGEVREGVLAFVKRFGRAPGLHVILVGDDPASAVYTRNKEKASKEVGMNGELHRLPAETSEAELLALIARLNDDASVDGILVQLPLPKSIREMAVLDAVSPAKDVDGFHPQNAGLLASGRPALVPCTPRGSRRLIRESGATLAGAFVRERLFEELVVYLAPTLLGPDARPLLDLPVLARLEGRQRLRFTECVPVGDDLRITAVQEQGA